MLDGAQNATVYCVSLAGIAGPLGERHNTEQEGEGMTLATLKVGDVVRAARAIDYQPYATINRGETGTITKVDEDELGVYAVDVAWHTPHRGLKAWDNETYLVDPELRLLVYSFVGGVVPYTATN